MTSNQNDPAGPHEDLTDLDKALVYVLIIKLIIWLTLHLNYEMVPVILKTYYDTLLRSLKDHLNIFI